MINATLKKERGESQPLSPFLYCIYKANVVNDRFHVQKVYNDAIDEIRIDIRRELIKEENDKPKDTPSKTYSNGETMRQILARSKHTLMMSENKWTDIQRHRVNILFKHYPILKEAYALAMRLRQIFNTKTNRVNAMKLLDVWFNQVSEMTHNSFRAVIKTIRNHYPTILNYFLRRATNASAEAFNSKVKIFRTQMRGVRDRDFFIFRLVKLYA